MFKDYNSHSSSKGSLDRRVQFEGVCDWLIGYDSYTVNNTDGEMDSGFRYGQFVDYPMVLPGDRNVEVKVTSADVIHC